MGNQLDKIIFKSQKKIGIDGGDIYHIMKMKNHQDFEFSGLNINNIKDISDRPQIGEIIKKNMPILTLNITSHNKDNLLKKIKNRIKSAMKIIDCYNIELEYE